MLTAAVFGAPLSSLCALLVLDRCVAWQLRTIERETIAADSQSIL